MRNRSMSFSYCMLGVFFILLIVVSFSQIAEIKNESKPIIFGQAYRATQSEVTAKNVKTFKEKALHHNFDITDMELVEIFYEFGVTNMPDGSQKVNLESSNGIFKNLETGKIVLVFSRSHFVFSNKNWSQVRDMFNQNQPHYFQKIKELAYVERYWY